MKGEREKEFFNCTACLLAVYGLPSVLFKSNKIQRINDINRQEHILIAAADAIKPL